MVSPTLGPVGLGLVRREAEPGTIVSVGEHGPTAEIVELPFVPSPRPRVEVAQPPHAPAHGAKPTDKGATP